MKRIKPAFFKAKYVDRGGLRKQDISFSSDCTRNCALSANESRPDSPAINDIPVPDVVVSVADLHSVSAHENRRIQEQVKWNEWREELVNSVIKESSIAESTSCVWCNLTTAVVRYSYCGPHSFFCLKCAKLLHSRSNTFYVLELWKVRNEIKYCSNLV